MILVKVVHYKTLLFKKIDSWFFKEIESRQSTRSQLLDESALNDVVKSTHLEVFECAFVNFKEGLYSWCPSNLGVVLVDEYGGGAIPIHPIIELRHIVEVPYQFILW